MFFLKFLPRSLETGPLNTRRQIILSNVECKKALFQKLMKELNTHTATCIHFRVREKKTEHISSDIVGPEKCFWGSEPFPHTIVLQFYHIPREMQITLVNFRVVFQHQLPPIHLLTYWKN